MVAKCIQNRKEEKENSKEDLKWGEKCEKAIRSGKGEANGQKDGC